MINIISKLEYYTKEELQDVLNTSNTFKEVLEKVGLTSIGNNYKTLHKYIEKHDLSTEHIDNNRGFVTSHAKYTSKESFINAIENGICKIKPRPIIERLVKYGLKEYRCEICGIDSWNNKPIVLELHHKNGNHDDGKLSNLQLLCPNCHSQTDNFRALNISK